MKRLTILSFLLTASFAAQAQNLTPAQQHGKEVFDKWCQPCHGAEAGGVLGGLGEHALPGTSALQVKYKGDLPALLEERTDLAPSFIRTVVREGLNGMPITRKTEVSESDLDDIIAYLTRRR